MKAIFPSSGGGVGSHFGLTFETQVRPKKKSWFLTAKTMRIQAVNTCKHRQHQKMNELHLKKALYQFHVQTKNKTKQIYYSSLSISAIKRTQVLEQKTNTYIFSTLKVISTHHFKFLNTNLGETCL